MDLAMNIIEDIRQKLNLVNLHEDNLVALPLINLFVEACHVIFLRKLDVGVKTGGSRVVGPELCV